MKEKLLKLWHRFLANLLGKFWVHCPRCLEHFGGHQPHGTHVEFKEGSQKVTYRIVCGDCHKESEN